MATDEKQFEYVPPTYESQATNQTEDKKNN